MGIVLSMLVAVTSVLPAQLPLDTPPVPVLSNADAVRHIEFDPVSYTHLTLPTILRV